MPEERKQTDAGIQKRIEESKKYSLKDGAFANATAGFGDAYISPYIIAMNATNAQVGLLTSLPNLFATLFQLPTSKLMEKYSRRRIFSLAIFMYCVMWIPIVLTSLLFLHNITAAPLLAIIFWTVSAACQNLAVPAWTSWIGDLVKREEAGRFFGLRNGIGGVTGLTAMLLAGLILHRFKLLAEVTHTQAWLFAGFGFIFTLAMTCRLISRGFALKQYEPEFRAKKENYFSFLRFVKESPSHNYGRFTLYVTFTVLTVNMAAPFYAVYMLRVLGFSYVQYMLVMVAATVATFTFMPVWGRFADRFGNIRTLKIAGCLIPIVCFIWLVSPGFTWFFCLQVFGNFFSGFAWSGFNLAAGNFVYDAATTERRSLYVAYSNAMNGAGVFVGANIGGFLATHLPLTVITLHRLMFISLISGLARYVVALIMLPKLKEMRSVEKYRFDWRVMPIAQIPIAQIPYYVFKVPVKLLGIIKKNTKIGK